MQFTLHASWVLFPFQPEITIELFYFLYYVELLNDITNQKTELDALQAESEALEAELNDLMIKFQNEQAKFQSCSRP